MWGVRSPARKSEGDGAPTGCGVAEEDLFRKKVGGTLMYTEDRSLYATRLTEKARERRVRGGVGGGGTAFLEPTRGNERLHSGTLATTLREHTRGRPITASGILPARKKNGGENGGLRLSFGTRHRQRSSSTAN